MSRRGFVRSAALSAAALPALSRTGTADATAHGHKPPPGSHRALPAAGGFYAPNAGPLQPTAFLRLPPGSVRPAGWLGEQLQLQLSGLCGRYQDISHFLDYSTIGWTNPGNAGWEEVPYWLRGYSDLAYATGDQTALSGTERWINGILATQQSDGFFGPSALRTSLNGGPDFWPYLPLIKALRMFQEYSSDPRIIPAQIGENYVQFAGTSQFPQYEVHATTPWNYGLALDSANPASSLSFADSSAPLASNPFTHGGNPLTISAPAQRIPAWRADDQNIISTLQQSPVLEDSPPSAACRAPTARTWCSSPTTAPRTISGN